MDYKAGIAQESGIQQLGSLGESPRLLRADGMSNSELTQGISARNKTTERDKQGKAWWKREGGEEGGRWKVEVGS